MAIINSDTLFPARLPGKLTVSLDGNPVLAAVGPMRNAATCRGIAVLEEANGESSVNPDFGLPAAGRGGEPLP